MCSVQSFTGHHVPLTLGTRAKEAAAHTRGWSLSHGREWTTEVMLSPGR